MSRLAELIEELCPDGVEFRRLDELFATRNGYTPSRGDMSAWDSHDIPCFRMEDIRENGGILDRAMTYVSSSAVKNGVLFPENSMLVATSATIGAHALITVPHLSNQRFTSLQLKDEYRKDFDYRFLYYYCFILDAFCLDHVNVSSFPSVDMKAFRSFEFPLVPLAVQREIVRILDQFTTLEAELEVELEAELEARRAQYEHYRNHLLSYDSLATCGPVDMVELGSVVTLLDSRRIPLKKGDRVSGEYPYYGASGIVDYVDSYIFDEDLLLVSEDGANLKARTKPIAFSTSGRVWVNNHAHVLKVESSFYQKFLEEYLNSLDLEPYLVGSTQPKLNQSGLLSIPVPLPTEQALERSVLLLEKLKLFVTDFSAGLPAEIAARRAQYEHYRDRLLSFPEKRVSDRESS